MQSVLSTLINAFNYLKLKLNEYVSSQQLCSNFAAVLLRVAHGAIYYSANLTAGV